jgi:hypothetical protein
MDPNHSSKRRRRDVRLAPEILESRNLMTGGAGSTFAIVPGTITTGGGVTAVKFTIDPSHFTIPKGKFDLGIDVVAQPGSKAKPMITTVFATDAHGLNTTVRRVTHGTYDPHLKQKNVAGGSSTSSVIAPIKLDPHNPTAPQTFTVTISDKGTSGGTFLVGFYLPGDVKGNGTVDAADVTSVKQALGARANTTTYAFDADANRDGRISATDLRYAQDNLGVSVNVSPVVSANLDPASVTNVQDRVTHSNSVRFNGVATPGALIKFDETSSKVPPAAIYADKTGNYNLTVPVAPGANTFKVTTVDGFGQSISGTISPVNYIVTPPVTPATLAAMTSTMPKTNISVTKS